MIPAIDFDSSLQSSLDEFSEETFEKLEEGANPDIVTEIAISFENLVLTFFLELDRRFMQDFSQKHQQSFRGYQYKTEN